MTAAMQDEDDNSDVGKFLDALDRALTVHEAGHAVVARRLGAQVAFVEIDLATGNGGSRSSDFTDQVKNLAVCIAGCRAEHLLAEPVALRQTKRGDFRRMREQLSRLPEAERRAARAEAYRLAETILSENAATVHRVADELMARRWKSGTATVRIEGDELIALLDA